MAQKTVTAKINGVTKTFTMEVPEGSTPEDINTAAMEAAQKFHEHQASLPENLRQLPDTASMGDRVGQAYFNMADLGHREAEGAAPIVPALVGTLATGGAGAVPGIAGAAARMGLSGVATGGMSALMDMLKGEKPDLAKAAVEGGTMALGEGTLGNVGRLGSWFKGLRNAAPAAKEAENALALAKEAKTSELLAPYKAKRLTILEDLGKTRNASAEAAIQKNIDLSEIEKKISDLKTKDLGPSKLLELQELQVKTKDIADFQQKLLNQKRVELQTKLALLRETKPTLTLKDIQTLPEYTNLKTTQEAAEKAAKTLSHLKVLGEGAGFAGAGYGGYRLLRDYLAK